jgi:hypothetical protein
MNAATAKTATETETDMKLWKTLLPIAVVALALAGTASAADPTAADDNVVLPTRVANAIQRTENSVEKAVEHVDEAEYTQALVSLRAVRMNLTRADKAARRQMNAVAAPDAETTPGPDSVIAVLMLDQEVATTVAGLFSSNTGTLVTALSSAMSTAQVTRDRLLNAVIALDPEGAGADYADGMADTLDDYSDEVANIAEALADDILSTGGAAALRTALARARATQAKINNAFGGGE